ncbi:MAG: T9SS C-terminal target domain-containing protein, partial [Calditrichaeota bacterium]
AARGNVVYMFGGSRVSGWTQESFKAGVDSSWNFLWEGLPALQTARGYGATAVLGDSIFLIGGDTFGGTTGEVEIFNLRTQQLEPGIPLPAPRLGMAAATLNNEIYVIGGSETRGGTPLAAVEIFSPITSIPPPANIPRDFVQITGYPNPFNGTIRLEVKLPSRGEHEIGIFDLQGRLIRRLYRGRLASGTHTFFWDATGEDQRPVASGIYVAMVRGNSYINIFKIVYVR